MVGRYVLCPISLGCRPLASSTASLPVMVRVPIIFEHTDVSTLFRTQNPIGFQSLLIGQWREIAIRGMAALTVIEHFDVFKHSCLGVFVRVKPLQINQLGL